MNAMYAGLTVLIVAGGAFGQAVRPATPVVAADPQDYGPSGQCLYLPTSGRAGNFHATRAMDCVLIRSSSTGQQVLENFIIDRSRDGIANHVKNGSLPRISGLTIQRFQIAARKRGIFLRGASIRDIVIRDGELVGAGQPDPSDIPTGIALGSSGQAGPRVDNVLIERVTAHDFKSTSTGDYPNADGFAAERDVFNLTFRDTSSYDNTDGCYDLKSSRTTLERTYAARCRYGYRLWGEGRATTIVAEDNRRAAIQMAAASTHWQIEYLDVRGSGASIEVNRGGGQLVVTACSGPVVVTGDPGEIAITTLTLGRGCTAPRTAVSAAETSVGPGVCAFAERLNDNNGDNVIDLGEANRALCGGAPRVRLTGRNSAGQYVYGRVRSN